MTDPPDEPLYRAVIPEDAHPELVEEELELFQRMIDCLGRDRVPGEMTAEESKALLDEAMSEDPELANIAERLDEVIRSHKGSVIRRMMEADKRKGNWP